jgi:hypothetical protein
VGIAQHAERTHWVNNNQFHGFPSDPKVLDLTRHETENFRIKEDGASISRIGIFPLLVFVINRLLVQEQIPNIICVSTQFRLIGENRHAQRSNPPQQSAKRYRRVDRRPGCLSGAQA